MMEEGDLEKQPYPYQDPEAKPDRGDETDGSNGTIEKDTEAGTNAANDGEDEPSAENAQSTVPDGGLWAWLQVLSGFLLYLNAW